MAEVLTEEEQKDINFLATHYKSIEKIGEGSYSFVYKAKCISKPDGYVAIKVITRTSAPTRVIDELKFIKKVGGSNNVIELLSVHRYEDQICAVFPFFECADFRSFLMDCSTTDLKNYIYNLLIAMKQIHSYKIIHRDVKPTNFLYCKNKRKGVLIDFGLAQLEKLGKRKETILDEKTNLKKKNLLFFNYNNDKVHFPPGYYEGDVRLPLKAARCGTRGFRAPEILFRSQRQTTAIDIWAVGVVFLILATKQYPFFASADDIDAIAEIATIFGHAEMRRAGKSNLRSWKSNISTIPEHGVPLEKVIQSLNPDCKLPAEGFDLLYRLLDLIADTRITAEDALNHPYFNDLK